MPDALVAKVQDWLRAHEGELLDDTLRMLRIPSLEEDPEPGAPFGPNNRKALDLALELGLSWGMETKDIEGYAGYAEFGSGKPLIMSLGHLDVVPVGPGWKYPPFGAEIVDGVIYARGATDDKGPTMASFYAMRAIQAVAPDLGVRFRQVFGCNEESGFKCVDRYVETEEIPTFGVAPDSGWPLIHGEKGIANLVVTVAIPDSEFQLLQCEGGQRPNIVIDHFRAVVRVAASAKKHVAEKLGSAWDRNVTAALDENGLLAVEAVGKAAHGSTPWAGDSAATRVFRFLAELSPLSTASFYEELLWMTHPSGVGLGIHGRDDASQDLTSNTGTVKLENGTLEMLFNVRYPVTWTGEQLAERCRTKLAELAHGFQLSVVRDSPPLYFPLDHPLVDTICRVVAEETGENRKPGTMGGGTYARAIPNTVSIGTGWEGDGGAHETDEHLIVEHLFRMSRIYAHIFVELAREATKV